MNLILTILLTYAGWTMAAKLKTLYEWKYIDYVWESDAQKQKAIETGVYDHTRIYLVDFQRISLSENQVLVTTPKDCNNPASLSRISNQTGDGGPLLEPYPNWDWHTSTDCTGIVSVARIILDKCNRLWTVDSGKIGDEAVCPAKIIVFNTETNEVMNQVIIPEKFTHSSVNTNRGRLEIQAVETRGESCNSTWVYIGDPEGYGLVIWNGSAIWRLENENVYAPDPAATLFSIGGENVTLERGVSTLVISPPGFIAEDYIFIRPLASTKSYAASLDDLHNSNTAGNKITYYRSNHTYHSQLLARDFSPYGVSLASFATRPVISCWNIQNPSASNYTSPIIEDDSALQFASTAKIFKGMENSYKYEQYWLLTNRLQKFLLGTMNFTEVNFRILVQTVADLVDGTVCEPKPHTIVSSIKDKRYVEFETVTVDSSATCLGKSTTGSLYGRIFEVRSSKGATGKIFRQNASYSQNGQLVDCMCHAGTVVGTDETITRSLPEKNLLPAILLLIQRIHCSPCLFYGPITTEGRNCVSHSFRTGVYRLGCTL